VCLNLSVHSALVRLIFRTVPGRYALAALSAAGGALLWIALDALTDGQQPLLVLLLPVLISSYLGGFGPGVASTLLSALIAVRLGMGNVASPDPGVDVFTVASFCAVGTLLSWINDHLRRVARRAEDQATSARRHAEAQRVTEDRLRGVVQCDMLGIAFWSSAGEISEPNDALLRMLGYTRDEVASVPLRWMSMAPRAELKRGLRALREIQERGFCTPFETVFLRKDGVRVPVLVGGGSFAGIPGSGAFFVLNMTQSRQMAEALYASERRYRLVAESMHDIVSLHEPDGRIVFISPSVRDRLGWDVAQTTGRSLYDLVHAEDRQRLEQRLTAGSSEEGSKAVVWRCRGRDGSWRWLETNTAVVDDDASTGGRRMLCTSRDVTDRKNLEEQLRQAHRMEAIGRLAGGVAHDFNNLLTVILGYASHLEHELSADDPVAIQATEIRGAAERAARLTQQLLAFSRQQVLQPRVVDLNESVTNLTSMLQRLIGSHVRLDVKVEDGLWTVLVDPGQIEQVLMNLVVNARDAMPRGGTITICTNTERLATQRWLQGVPIPAGDWVVVEVADTGEGMPAAIVSRIFEPFFTTKALGQGTGLGLSMVYGIVKQSGGFIFCDSTPGGGTTMRVYLPRALAAVEQAVPGVTVGTARGGTILVVEDEPAVRGLLSAVLQKAGYKLHEASSGAEALAQIDRIPKLDLLVTDVIMPEMTGVEVARRIVQLRPGTPVLYMSGYADEVLQHEDVVAGSSFLQKPFRPDVLMSKVRDIVEGVTATARA
jgi:PAS domain S-box-containing protein